MANRMNMNPVLTENLLSISWHDSNSIPTLNTANVMDYFADRSNPFYDRTCNNEIIKMQRLNPEHLQNMTGLEYILLHVQEPILYVIRKQHRHGPQQVTPMADYYVNAGVIYQAPDLASVLNSRLLSMVHHLQTAFDETSSFVRYHPNKGYSWDFKAPVTSDKTGKLTETDAGGSSSSSGSSAVAGKSTGAAAVAAAASKEEQASSHFQRQRVDMLLGELTKKFPIPSQMPFVVPTPTTSAATAVATTATATTPSAATTHSSATTAAATPTTTAPVLVASTAMKSELDAGERRVSPPEKKIKLSS